MRSIFDLRPAKAEKLDDLKAFVDRFGGFNAIVRSANPNQIDLDVAQFIAVRACLRMPMP